MMAYDIANSWIRERLTLDVTDSTYQGTDSFEVMQHDTVTSADNFTTEASRIVVGQ
jgi:hypothetical protein